MSLFYDKNKYIQGKMLIDIADIQNNGNILGADKTARSINLNIILNLPKLSWRFYDD